MSPTENRLNARVHGAGEIAQLVLIGPGELGSRKDRGQFGSHLLRTRGRERIKMCDGSSMFHGFWASKKSDQGVPRATVHW